LRRIFLIVSFTLLLPAFAAAEMIYNFNTGNLGFKFNAPFNDYYNNEAFITAVNFGMEDRKTRLGFEFSPFNAYLWTIQYDENNGGFSDISFLNIKFYWNVINTSSNISLHSGPFISANYFFVSDDFHWDRFIFSTGAHLEVRVKFFKINYTLWTTEIGYRNINGTSKFFISNSIDFLTFVAIILLAKSD
jgi:hypothetical protein